MSVRRASRSASISASAGRASRELIRANMKMKATRREFSTNGTVRKDGVTKQSASAPVLQHSHPKTELEAISQRHIDSEERYRTLFNLSPMAVYSIDASGVIRDFNRHAAELWGREPALGDTDQRFCGSFKMFRPDGTFMPHDQCPMAEVVSGKISAVYDGEVHIKRPDGSHVIVLFNFSPLKNDRGEVTGAINCFYDITERKQMEAALEKSKDLLEKRVRERTRELREANEELEAEIARRKGLEGEILEISDREQQRLGQELHDGLCQHLTAVAFMARSVVLRLKNHRVIQV